MKTMIKVESSNISAIGYEASDNTLFVEYSNGHLYEYMDVPQSLYETFLTADSKGKFMNENIKNRFDYKSIV